MRVLGLLAALASATLFAESTPGQFEPILARPLRAQGVAEYELKTYLTTRIPTLRLPATAPEWRVEAGRIREHVLNDVIFHGWPSEWIHSALRSQEIGVIESARGYRIRKIRFEVIPGMWAPALLYEPSHLSGKVPAILNLTGHYAREGKAIEFKQKRCINDALHGMLSLNAEWIGTGELAQKGNAHDFGAQLDLVGTNALGIFYLFMRKGLDYLDQHPNTDRSRLGVTGLSGGGWQTIVLSALDPRVAVAVPVAGYGSLASNIVHPKDTSQIEEDGTDLRFGQDYTHLTALRAPRPTLLIYNAQDNCCFRAPVVKDDLYTAIRPFFALTGAPDAFAWYENLVPGTHNYQLDNRLRSYRFFAEHFHMPAAESEIPVDSEVRTAEELTVGLPAENSTMLDVARHFAAGLHHPVLKAEDIRTKLQSVVRFQRVDIRRAWMVESSKSEGIETQSFDFGFTNGLGAEGVFCKLIATPAGAPVTVILDDRGKAAIAAEVADRVNRGQQVMALDVLFAGNSRPPKFADYALLLASTGDRPIGLESAQVIAVTRWLLKRTQNVQARLEADGMRSQLVARIAATLSPGLFLETVVRDGIASLKTLLDRPVPYRSAPDVFCLDLYKEFDLDTLSAPMAH